MSECVCVCEREKEKRERACCFPIHGREPPHKSNKTMDFDFLAGLSGCGICHRPATHWLVRWPVQTDETINLWWEDLYIAMWGSTECCKQCPQERSPSRGNEKRKTRRDQNRYRGEKSEHLRTEMFNDQTKFPLTNTSYNTAGHTAAA